jgi:hypothetical protein
LYGHRHAYRALSRRWLSQVPEKSHIGFAAAMQAAHVAVAIVMRSKP